MTEQRTCDVSAIALAVRNEIIAQRGDKASTLELCDAIDDVIAAYVEVVGKSDLYAEALYSDLLLSLQEDEQ